MYDWYLIMYKDWAECSLAFYGFSYFETNSSDFFFPFLHLKKKCVQTLLYTEVLKVQRFDNHSDYDEFVAICLSMYNWGTSSFFKKQVMIIKHP